MIFAIPLLDAVAIARAILRGHGVEGTIAWILAIIALPGLGAVIYLTMASPRVGTTTRRKIRATETLRQERSQGAAAVERGALPATFRLAEELTGLPATAGNRVEPLFDDDRAFEVIESAIRGARRSICAEYYMVRNDVTGRRFLGLLAEKAAAGVAVRFIHDAVGSAGIDRLGLQELERKGGRAQAFLPLNPFRRRWSIHLRNHKKLVIVDGEVAFTGGMNVGDEYSGRSRRRGERFFRDTHLELRGPVVQGLTQAFAEDWFFSTREPLALDEPQAPAAAAGTAGVAILTSGPDQEWNVSSHALFATIAKARQRLWIATPYFIPDQPTLRALVTAALSGVDVRILVPAVSDVSLARAAARASYLPLVDAGVRIFEYLPSMLHAKALVADSRTSLVGSANCDFRSFRLNFELGVIIDDPRFAARLEARFEEYLEQSLEISLRALEERPLLLRLAYGAVRLLSPLL